MRAGTAGKDMLTTAPRAQERARSPWWISKTGVRGGGEICAQEQVPCVAGPCKPRGHMRIHPVKVQPPAALGDPYPSLSSGCHKRTSGNLLLIAAF